MKNLVLFLLITGFTLTTRAQYWQQHVNYTIDVSLNDAERSLDGFIKIQYANNSPDTLSFIWIHCWPNAYKNDRTAFSEQLLGNGRSDFYFSDKSQKGYINRLDFRVDGQEARVEDHPQYIDIIKVLLPRPLFPGRQMTLTTPFHVQLPFNFSRGGYTLQTASSSNTTLKAAAYQVTQWYPKPAVYDNKGWHPLPYLDQGEFYSEYGDFDVKITVPQNFTVAATGELQDAPGRQEPGPTKKPVPPPPYPTPSKKGSPPTITTHPSTPKKSTPPRKPTHPSSFHPHHAPIAEPARPPSDTTTKTLHYKEKNIHDFAWFADRAFHTDHDTLQLPSGRIIDVYSYYTPAAGAGWSQSIQYIKDAIRFRSALIGEYPFNVVTAVEAGLGTSGGMEYPTITSINVHGSAQDLDLTIEHEVGHNWFYAVLGTNERRYPWMDEGINTYYDNRYAAARYPLSSHPHIHANNAWLLKKVPDSTDPISIGTLAWRKEDQPISTASEDFTEENYFLIAYAKTGLWMKELEDSLGTQLFDSCMQEYYRRWQFRHPYPDDFKAVITTTSHRSLTPLFDLLDRKGPLPPHPPYRQLRPTFLFNFRNTDKYNYINIMPAAGFNNYDRFMIGALIHNFNLPPNHWQFYIAPLYATGSHRLNGTGHIAYINHPGRGSTPPQNPGSIAPPESRHNSGKIEVGVDGARFSTLSNTDSNSMSLYGGFWKITPYIRWTFPRDNPRSTVEKWIEWRTFAIGENSLGKYVQKITDSLYYPTAGKYNFRYLNQLNLGLKDDRVLYPYTALLQFQQAASFYRINFTGNYFFNYPKGGGLALRLFGARFGYIGSSSESEDLSRFMPKLTALRGNEDYTYTNYFFGRNEFNGFASQQILMRDGGLKLRTDLFQGLQGRSDNWVASLNLNSTLPPAIVPRWLPIRVFLDIGTYSDTWQDNPPTSHFLYVGGLELSFLHDVLHFYAPIIYSSDFSNQLKTVPDQNKFGKKISFSIDIQNINFHKIFPNLTF